MTALLGIDLLEKMGKDKPKERAQLLTLKVHILCSNSGGDSQDSIQLVKEAISGRFCTPPPPLFFSSQERFSWSHYSLSALWLYDGQDTVRILDLDSVAGGREETRGRQENENKAGFNLTKILRRKNSTKKPFHGTGSAPF